MWRECVLGRGRRSLQRRLEAGRSARLVPERLERGEPRQAEQVAERHGGEIARQVLHRPHIARQARQHVAGLPARQDGGIQGQGVIVQPPAQVRPHLLSEHGHEVDAQGRGRREHHSHQGQRSQWGLQVLTAMRRPQVIDGEAAGDGEG